MFLTFVNVESGKVNVIHRLKDNKNFGLIEPEAQIRRKIPDESRGFFVEKWLIFQGDNDIVNLYKSFLLFITLRNTIELEEKNEK